MAFWKRKMKTAKRIEETKEEALAEMEKAALRIIALANRVRIVEQRVTPK